MSDDEDICGHEKNDGEECTFNPSYPDGKCGHHTGSDEADDTGRPTKLSKSRQEKIAGAIEAGKSMNLAARKAGVTPNTVFNWLNRGESDKEEGRDNEYTEFFDRITRAKGQGEDFYFSLAVQLARENEDHRFIASLMKQRYPDSWGETETGVEADTVKLEVSERVADTWPEQ